LKAVADVMEIELSNTELANECPDVGSLRNWEFK
jgi:hypothetical protein